MNNYKINRNKPVPHDEQISKHKDFSKILGAHQKVLSYKDATKPLYKRPGFMGLMVILSVVILLFVITEKEKSEEKLKKDTTEIKDNKVPAPELKQNKTDSLNDTSSYKSSTTEVSSKPIVTAKSPDVVWQNFKVDPSKGAVFYPGTTRILIPPFAFTDNNGNIIQKEVEIRYRDFKNPVDMFLANIPMHYKSDQLISAGMFEIRGSSEGKPVKIHKTITIEISSPDHKNYNSYHLNDNSREWEFISKEKRSMRFVFQAEEKDFPEMIPFKDVIWEFAINDHQTNPDEFKHIFSKTWTQFFLTEKIKPESPNNAKLKKNSSEPKFLTLPVALTSNKELNDKIIQAKYNEYYEAMKKKQRNEKLLEEERRKQKEWLESPEGKAYSQWTKSDQGQKQILSSRIISVFSVNQFGIWNCDTPEKYPQGAEVIPQLKDAYGNKLEFDLLLMVDYNKNSLYRFNKGTPLKFNPKSENVLWASLPGGKLAVFEKDKFKKSPSQGEATFVMDIIDINGKTEVELKNILGMKNHITAKQEEKDKNPVSTYERTVVMKKETDSRVLYEQENVGIDNNGGRFVHH